MKEAMSKAISKMRQAWALTIILKSKEGQQHGLFSEDAHRKEYSKYAEAIALIYTLYDVIKYQKSPAELHAFADETVNWAINIESRLCEIKGINDVFHYFKPEEVEYVYESIAVMTEDLLHVLLPDVISQVHNILIDSQNKAP